MAIGARWRQPQKKAGEAEPLNPLNKMLGIADTGPTTGGKGSHGASVAETLGKAEAHGKTEQKPAKGGSNKPMPATCGKQQSSGANWIR